MFDTKVVEKMKTHFVVGNFFFENRAIYEKMWKNIVLVERDRPQMTVWRMGFGCWIRKATNTHAFPQQRW
jgi:hypothetical protein